MEVSLLLVTSSTLSSESFPIPTEKKIFIQIKCAIHWNIMVLKKITLLAN